MTATLILVAFCLVLPWIGYPIASFAFVLALLLRLGSDWRAALGTAVASAAASHYLFAVLLDVPLPRGPW
jgi:putative tricarboxylic transport membrane protein